MSKINLLDESVYNLISAGEVVENPASVVKELVENAIDAGADEIIVSIADGGIKNITVSDNGIGIEKEDLQRAVLPHATSKISTAADLNVIGTLGFRGEALASICAVSETKLESKYFEADHSAYIVVKGGEITSSSDGSLAVGTRVSVDNLFYNTPARYAFLKTPKGEENNVTSTMIDLVFANPTVSFTYKADQKVIFSTSGEGLFEAIYPIYGEETAANMIPLSIEEKGYRISGYTARPATEAIRGNRNRQVFIVNGRPIFDQTLSAVVQNAYGEHLMKRTFPSVVIDIVMPFDMVDVNVHPNKKEVRFADKKKINGLLYNAVKTAVEEDTEQRQKELFSVFCGSSTYKNDDVPIEKPVEEVSATVDTPETTERELKKERFIPQFLKNQPIVQKKVEKAVESRPKTESEDFLLLKDSLFNANNDVSTMVLSDSFDPKSTPSYRVVGQLFDTYLVLELENEVVFLDQHATHERILYDKLIEQTKKEVMVQDLLLPFDYEVSPKDRPFLQSNLDNFERLGFRVVLSQNRISVYSVPCVLTNLDIGGFLQELIDYNKTFEELASSSLIKDKIAKIACKRAIKGGDKLTDDQIDYVLRYFFQNGVPMQCPHGRPTMIKMSRSDIEKKFGRIV